MTYDAAIEHSAQQYVDHLRKALRSDLSAETRAAAQAAVSTTEAALTYRREIRVSDVSLTLELLTVALERCPDAASVLINESTPGLGTSSPLAVFVGKEAAYDSASPLNFLLESVALSALWLIEPHSTRMISALLQRPTTADFLREPARFYPPTTGGHTWQKIAKVLELRTGRSCGPLQWGHGAYLVELNAVPSKNHKGGSPSPGRVAFLKKLVSGFASARVRTLVLHSQERHHERAQADVAASFLGITSAQLPGTHRMVVSAT